VKRNVFSWVDCWSVERASTCNRESKKEHHSGLDWPLCHDDEHRRPLAPSNFL